MGTAGTERPASRRRYRRAAGWAFSLTLVGAAGFGVYRAVERNSPVPLASLPAGACYDFTQRDLQAMDQQTNYYPAQAVRKPCNEPHRGEVAGQQTLDGTQGVAELGAATRKTCTYSFIDYNPDAWAPPANVVLVTAPDLRAGTDPRSVVCVYDGSDIPLTRPLRVDPGRFSPAQRAYLDAVRPYDAASSSGFDLLPDTGPIKLTTWAQEMAEAEQRTLDELGRTGAPAGAEQPFAAVLAHHREALAAWQAAAAKPVGVHENIDAARAADTAAMEPDRAVRAALGLSTAMRPRGYSL